jgi:hypothetical protein
MKGIISLGPCSTETRGSPPHCLHDAGAAAIGVIRRVSDNSFVCLAFPYVAPLPGLGTFYYFQPLGLLDR